MKRLVKTRGRQAHERLVKNYERQFAESNKRATDAEAALLQSQSEKQTENGQKLAALEGVVKDIQMKVSEPPRNFGFLENLDATVAWLAFAWFLTGYYSHLIKSGQPWLFVCFHIGTIYLVVRSIIQLGFMFRYKFETEKLIRQLSLNQFLIGLAALADVWAHGQYDFPMSLSTSVILGISGAYSLYCGVISAIKSLVACLAEVRMKIQQYLDPTRIMGTVIWPQLITSPVYGKPHLLLPRVEAVQKKIMQNSSLPLKILYVFEFWKVKRHLRDLVRKNKDSIIATGTISAP